MITLPAAPARSLKAIVWEIVRDLDPNQEFVIDQMVVYLRQNYPHVESRNFRDTVRKELNGYDIGGQLINLGRDASGRVKYKRGEI